MADLDHDQEHLRLALAASNSKLNSNPKCRTSLHIELPENIENDDSAEGRPSTVRFVEDPVEVPPAVYFDCSKIRKVDTVFTRKMEDSVVFKKSIEEVDRLESGSEDDTVEVLDSGSQSPRDEEPQRRKCPQRHSSPVGVVDLSG